MTMIIYVHHLGAFMILCQNAILHIIMFAHLEYPILYVIILQL